MERKTFWEQLWLGLRALAVITVMLTTAGVGQAWADEPTYGIIHYTQGGTDGGRLSFSTTLDMTYNAQTDFTPYGVSSGNDWIYTYTVTGNILTDGKVYVRALPSFGYTVTGMTITVEPSAPSSTAEAPRRGAPGVASTIPVTPVEGHSGVYTFPMPTDGTNVTVTASFPVSPPIDVDYLDATGTKKTAQAYVLDGAELYLGESDQEFWYVCNSDIDYRTKVTLSGDIHFILADGKTMTISAGTQHAIYAENGVTIHGQSGASGKLIAESTGSNGIYSKGDVTIISADVAFTSTGTTGFGVQANPGNITITDSKVTVNSGYHGIVATNVNNTTKGNITINGSQVTAIGGTPANNYGIYAAGGDITLGWKNTTDFIKASSYFIEGSGNVKTADGKPFIAYTPAATANDSEKQAVLIQGNTTLTANAIAAIAGKVLRPATTDDVTVKYLDAKGDEQNTAEDNITDNDIVYVLQGGGATTLPGGWYVAQGEVNYTDQLRFTGDAHLILADGAEMTVGTATAPIDYAAVCGDTNLAIYGQGGETEGKFSATGSPKGLDVSGQSVSAITINGGQVTAIGDTDGCGINASSVVGLVTITINGGQVEANGGIYAGSSQGTASVTINGGQVTATGGTNGYGINVVSPNNTASITLGWKNTTDFIKASSYNAKVLDNGTASVKTADGKRFVAYNMASEGDISANCIIGSTTGETTLNDTDLGNIAGKTLRPLDGYYVKDQAGLTFSGKTNDDGSAKPDFTITTGTGNNAVTTPYYIYKAADEVTLTSDKNYGQNGIWFITFPFNVIAEATAAPGTVVTSKTFAMPAQDFTINDVDYYNTGVKYMDWDDTEKKLVEKTTPDGTKVRILTGTTGPNTSLGGNWYVVNDFNTTSDENGHSIDVAHNHTLQFSSNVNLILTDGSEMTVTGNSSGILVSNDLAIYGQNAGTGSLTAIGGSSDGITANGNVTINGGNITATGSHGISAYCDNNTVTINGGKVTATGGTDGYGIYASANFGNATIILNLTNGSDFIKASSYNVEVAVSGTASVKIPAGKALAIDGTSTILGGTDADYIFGDGTNATLDDIAGKELHPVDYITTGGVTYFAMCRLDGDWKPMDGVKAYVVTGYDTTTGTVTLSEAPLGGLPNGVPVILMKDADGDGSPDGNLGATFTLVGADTTEAENIENSVIGKGASPLFTAGDGTKTMAQLIFEATGSNDTSDYLVFVLEKGVFKMAAFSDTSIPVAGTCFLIVSKLDVLLMIRNGVAPAAAAGARTIAFDLGGSDDTGIERLTFGSSLNGGEWYDLQGRRLDVSPKQKGVYINRGKKVVIK